MATLSYRQRLEDSPYEAPDHPEPYLIASGPVPAEESDRWTQAIRLTEIAAECFASAIAREWSDP